MIGYAFCGSFCTLSRSLAAMNTLISDGYDILPIVSENVYKYDTRFFSARDFIDSVEKATGKEVIHTIVDAEPLGPKTKLDALIIAPCSGNTLAKMALGITDSSVSMAAKAHLRADRPTLIALASNDSMSSNLKNIGTVLMRKSVYFVPMLQDDPTNKPHSLVADFTKIPECLLLALEKKQPRPLFISKP
ncbi:MAG: dipicolinate synthase subunit B [Eubacteriales bacterium]|nr:dipicolinate synthase subunit B [Eubacteriales bacterium]